MMNRLHGTKGFVVALFVCVTLSCAPVKAIALSLGLIFGGGAATVTAYVLTPENISRIQGNDWQSFSFLVPDKEGKGVIKCYENVLRRAVDPNYRKTQDVTGVVRPAVIGVGVLAMVVGFVLLAKE